MNPRRASRWVFRNHVEDEFAEFNADALPARANWMPREPGPIQLEAGPVPSHNGLRLNENQCLPPPGPEPPQYHPEKSVGNSMIQQQIAILANDVAEFCAPPSQANDDVLQELP